MADLSGNIEYKVKSYVPKLKGCGAVDHGWDEKRCKDFENFLNSESKGGWALHSSDYREVTIKGCGGGKGIWLVCVFQRSAK